MIENIRILADYREKRSGIPELLQSKVNVKIVNLVAGDYLIDEQVIVERKTNEDFIQSLLSNRLFEQCSKLKRESDFQLFIIEGDPYSTNHNISRQAVKGALLSISAAWQIPVFYTKNTCETAEVLIMTGKQKLQNKILSLRKGYKPKRLKNQQLYFLQGLPLIGPSLARRLLISFGSIEDIMHASSKELAGIRGIGKAKATGIKGFISYRYK